MSGAVWIHRECTPAPGGEEIAAARDAALDATPMRDGGMHWLFVMTKSLGWISNVKCGICRESFKDGDTATGFSPD